MAKQIRTEVMLSTAAKSKRCRMHGELVFLDEEVSGGLEISDGRRPCSVLVFEGGEGWLLLC